MRDDATRGAAGGGGDGGGGEASSSSVVGVVGAVYLGAAEETESARWWPVGRWQVGPAGFCSSALDGSVDLGASTRKSRKGCFYFLNF